MLHIPGFRGIYTWGNGNLLVSFIPVLVPKHLRSFFLLFKRPAVNVKAGKCNLAMSTVRLKTWPYACSLQSKSITNRAYPQSVPRIKALPTITASHTLWREKKKLLLLLLSVFIILGNYLFILEAATVNDLSSPKIQCQWLRPGQMGGESTVFSFLPFFSYRGKNSKVLCIIMGLNLLHWCTHWCSLSLWPPF